MMTYCKFQVGEIAWRSKFTMSKAKFLFVCIIRVAIYWAAVVGNGISEVLASYQIPCFLCGQSLPHCMYECKWEELKKGLSPEMKISHLIFIKDMS